MPERNLEVFLLVPPPFPKPQQWHESEDCAAETCPDSDRTPESESCTPGCSALPHYEQIHPKSGFFLVLSCGVIGGVRFPDRDGQLFFLQIAVTLYQA